MSKNEISKKKSTALWAVGWARDASRVLRNPRFLYFLVLFEHPVTLANSVICWLH